MRKLFAIILLLLAPSVYASEVTIADLDARVTLEATDLVECEDVSPAGTYKCTLTELKDLVLTYINSESELETLVADMANIIQAAEIDSESELEAILADVANMIVSTEIDSESELEALLADVTDLITDNDLHAGTDVTADLEEEDHAAEHADGAADEIVVTVLASACTDVEVLGGDGAGGVECQADAGGGTGAISDAGDPMVPNTTGKDFVLGDGVAALTGKQEIGGDADQPQFVTQGHSSQTDSLWIALNNAGTQIFNLEDDGQVLVQSIYDLDGPGTLWSIDATGNALFASVGVTPSTTPTVDFDDSDDAGANPDASIVVDCPTANDCDMSIAVNSGADSETVVLKLDTTDAGATTVQVGAPGTNYVNVSEAGVMSFVGSADLDLPDDSVDEADMKAVNAAVDEDIVTYEGTTGDWEYHTFDELAPVESKCVYIEDPVTDEELLSIWRAGATVTISAIWCEATAGTSVLLDLEVDDGTPTGVNGSDITCTTSGVEDATLAGDTEVADGETLDLDLGTVTGSVTSLTVCWEY